MTDTAPSARNRGSRAPLVIAAGALVAVQAAAWFYFRARQANTDDQTRDRLAPRRPRA